MRDRLAEFGSDTEIVLITFTEPQMLGQYQTRHQLRFPILVDPDRSAYRAYGLGRGSAWRVWGWRAARRYSKILRADGLRGLRRPTEDTLQLGGDFVVGPDGKVTYGFCGEGPDDRPTIDALIAATVSASSTDA